MDTRARAVQAQPTPPNAGTKHLGSHDLAGTRLEHRLTAAMIGHERGRAGGLDSRWRSPLKDETWPALAGFFLEHAHHHHSGKLTRSRSRSFRCYVSGKVRSLPQT